MKQLLLVLLLLSCALGRVWAQTATLRGQVRAGGQPVPFATVALKGTALGTTASETGTYTLKQVPPGTYQLVATAVGYKPAERTVTVQAGATAEHNLLLASTANELQDVVISGTLGEVVKSESPVPVEIYTPKFFQKNPAPSLFENLTLVNGVRPQLNCNVCNTGDIHIHGLEGPYTMVLIDGMPIVSALSTVYGLSGIPNSMVERIEVVKGPASTLYGSEALGGLINVITKDPQKAPRLSADGFATSHGETNLDLGTTLRAGKATSLLTGNVFHFNQRRDVNRDGFTDLPTQKRASVFNKWSLARPENQVATLAGRYYYEDRFGGQLPWRNEFRGTDSIYGESIYTSRYELLGQYQLPIRGQKVMLSGSYNRHRQNSVYGTTLYNATQHVGFGQLTWTRALSIRHNLLLGSAYRYTWYDDNTPATEQATTDLVRNQPDVVQLPGVFAQDEWRLTEHATLLTGLRLDYNSRHGAILSPRANYKWGTDDGSRVLRLGVGNGFRVVNLFTEDHAALTGARTVVVEEQLRPERSWNATLNYVHQLRTATGSLTFDGSLFWTYFTNKITPDYDTDPNLIVYRNLRGFAVSRGATLNADLALGTQVKIMAGITALDVYRREQRTPDGPTEQIRQLHTPAFSGTYAASYTAERWGLTLDYTGQVNGPMLLPVQPNDYRPSRSPWYSLQNLQATKRLGKGLEVYGGVKNLLNFLPRHVLIRAFDPFDKYIEQDNPNGYTFDTEYNYAPVQGRRGFLGVRYTL
ncbi:TonB-dependent receptor [Hymenobacter latericus]|uniref:TonB-dependent receptor n=1 Tax=Hymenobacter sp. YIM 151858-1 TaxID=2987688 RepID=UPI002227C2C2|nr:TonB-dependent receptor [Hymenobacter sp. YIM 151858-1]UYZ58816.1 TonB-dependent receptor [Hymenobacter sp. YIM 151858-1]